MKTFKAKASRFFKDGPSQDEKAANASTGCEADFDAGIERGLRKKPSQFFRAKNQKPLPAAPRDDHSVEVHPGVEDQGGQLGGAVVYDAPKSTEKPLPEPPVATDQKVRGRTRKAEPADPVIKKRPSLASLRSTSSRMFRTNTDDHDAPPMPQLPINTPTPKPRRPTLRPFESARSSRSSAGRIVSISRPVLSAQPHNLTTSVPTTVPFTKPSGPPPPRPPRPDSLDDECIALMRDGSARMVLCTPARTRTLTASTSSSASHSTLASLSSIEAYTRLGLFSGRPSPTPPVLNSPLAASFPASPSRPLPLRDSAGNVERYGRFSAYVKAMQGYSSGYDDAVEQEDKKLGPVEYYSESKCGDWTLEKRVSAGSGEGGPGMLFRDRRGGWHFVADI